MSEVSTLGTGGRLQRRNRDKAKEQEQGSREEERQVGGARLQASQRCTVSFGYCGIL